MLEKVGLLPFFAGRIFSALEIPGKKTKPAPDVFLLAAEKLKADPANTFVIENSVHGVAGAKAPACASSASPELRTAIPAMPTR